MDGCIAVQARQCEAETDWLLDLADRHSWIVGVVGWVDLRAEDVAGRLERWAGSPHLLGMRHVVQDEPDGDFLLTPAFVRGVRAVLARGLAYDVLITPRQARHIPAFADAVGEGRLILDHGAKPHIAGGGWQPWARDVAAMAEVPGLFCKISGLVTEASNDWRAADLAPYLNHLLACFGGDRLIFGSDWPVCQLAATYRQVHDLVAGFVARTCPEHRDAIFGGNAVRAYRPMLAVEKPMLRDDRAIGVRFRS